jgi:two-component system chemotaxis response regulator CheB
VLVVMHVPAHLESGLARILSRAGRLPARQPEDGDEIRPGEILVAPPDRHLLVDDGRVRLIRGPKENGHRPAVDPLFRSAAKAYGPRVLGVVLTGSRSDGTLGLHAVKQQGGVAVVQEDALFPGMPESAMHEVEVDHVLPVAEIGGVLTRLVEEPVEDPSRYPEGGLVDDESDDAGAVAGRLEQKAREADEQAEVIQRVLVEPRLKAVSAVTPDNEPGAEDAQGPSP